MVAYQFRMPAGIPGDINRAEVCTVEPNIITPAGSTGAPTAYGIPIVIDATSGKVRMMTAADSQPYGLLARPFPTEGGNPSDPLGTGTPISSGQCDVLKRGYMTVLLSGSTAAVKGQPVYIWTGAAGGSHIVGGFEAAAGSFSATSAPKSGGNTGTGTMGAVTPGADAKPGAYTLTMTAATTYNVYDPSGNLVGNGNTGAAFNDPELSFTLTAGGTAFVAGDGFVITLSSATVAPGPNTFNAYFMGPADANGNTEIAWNL